MSAGEEARAEAMADLFFGRAKSHGLLPQPADDPAAAFMAGASAALAWAATEEGRPFLRMLECEPESRREGRAT